MLFATAAPAWQQVEVSRGVTTPARDWTSFRDEDKIAVLVGIDKYPATSGVRELKYASRDAIELWPVLQKQGYKTPLSEKEPVLVNSMATRTAIKKTVQSALEMLKGKGTFLFFFAGHGIEAKNGKQYLAPYEVDKDDLERSALAVDELIDIVKASPVQRKVLFIDACREEGKRTVEGSEWFSHVAEAQGLNVMYASGSKEPSYEDPDYQHGVFTFHLLKALGGEAAVRGVVTFSSLQSYLTAHLKGDPKARGQVPHVNSMDTTQGGDLLLTGNLVDIDLPVEFSSQEIMTAGKRYYSRQASTRASEFYNQGKYAEAGESVRLALSLDPANDGARRIKVGIALSTGGEAAATAACDDWIAATPSSADALSGCVEALGDSAPEIALGYFNRVPKEKQSPYRYTWLLSRSQQLEKLIAFYKDAGFADLSDSRTNAQFSEYIDALIRSGKAKSAEDLVTLRIKQWKSNRAQTRDLYITPDLTSQWVVSGLYALRSSAREKQDRDLLALVDLTEAMARSAESVGTRGIDVRDYNVDLSWRRSLLWAKLGYESEAVEDLGRIQSASPEGQHVLLGYVYRSMGKQEQAAAEFSKAIEADRVNSRALRGRGYSYTLLGNTDQAAQDFVGAVALDPKDAVARRDYALLLSRLGKSDEALVQINEAIRLDHYYAEAYALRAEILTALSRAPDAGHDRERAAQLGWKSNPKLP